MSGIRLSAGLLGGRRLEVAPGVRPTEARVREALFSIWRPRIVGAAFLDLFAGSGAVGLEAFSAGASRVALVEQAPRMLRVLERNVGGLGLAPDAAVEIVRGRLPEVLHKRPAGRFDLLFADPPYAFTGHAALLEAAAGTATADAEMVIEHSARCDMPEVATGWRRFDARRYGESGLTFYRLE